MLLPRLSRQNLENRRSAHGYSGRWEPSLRRSLSLSLSLSLCFCRACTCQELRRSHVCDTRCAQLHIAHDGNGVPTAVSAVATFACVSNSQLGADRDDIARFYYSGTTFQNRPGWPPGDLLCLNN